MTDLQRRAVDEQGEQHQAGREHRDEPLHLGVQRRFSVTASASTKVKAPRSPPQAMASL